ncbi:MAG TPA: hypothetical protein VJX16_07280 [Terriglobales bacterium]|nr:hypothetical protein [Terriglobales bacterium]
MKNYRRDVPILLLLAFCALMVHGYHPGVEDAEIYLPGIKKQLNPALYPHNSAFFASHARMTLFPNLMAWSIRISHLPVDWALFLWQWFSIFLLLLGCWHLGRLAFRDALARWGGVALIAALLTIPVAGTALYVMDEYLSTRSFSTPAVLFVLVNAIDRKFLRALLWAVFTGMIHPLMAVFGASYVVLFLWMNRRQPEMLSSSRVEATSALLLLPLGLFPPLTDAYREVLTTRPYFFLLQWRWYEWVGIFAPLALLWLIRWIARSQDLPRLEAMSSATVIFGLIFFCVSLIITIPARLANFAELQPMRSLHLIYILLFVSLGGLLAQWILRDHVWRWTLLFLPLCAGMWYAQRQLFPATPHVEWPGAKPKNEWVQAFLWIRQNTPREAYFALDPNYMVLAGEDQHGFRALAERSRLADVGKDSGAVTMFPALAETWRQQVRAQQGWKSFQASDYRRLQQMFGVNWVVLQRPAVVGLSCPYQNNAVLVCHLE